MSQKVSFLPAMIAFTICTNQFQNENGCESLKLAWYQIRLFQENTNFRSEKQGYFFQIFSCPWKFSIGMTQKSRFQFTFQSDFSETFC